MKTHFFTISMLPGRAGYAFSWPITQMSLNNFLILDNFLKIWFNRISNNKRRFPDIFRPETAGFLFQQVSAAF